MFHVHSQKEHGHPTFEFPLRISVSGREVNTAPKVGTANQVIGKSVGFHVNYRATQTGEFPKVYLIPSPYEVVHVASVVDVSKERQGAAKTSHPRERSDSVHELTHDHVPLVGVEWRH